MAAGLITFKGVVQGVGFRPFVFRLAESLNVKGWVNNNSTGVMIHAEGENLREFYRRLLAELPPLAVVKEHTFKEIEPLGYNDFRIVASTGGQAKEVLISPDVATCQECQREILDPEERRFHYPFTNCTNCGPRYTIICDSPYDRSNTTMSKFPLCPDCQKEYENPSDRRFHAQPVACPVCGPKALLQDAHGHVLSGLGQDQLKNGAIVAIKGLGGFHLACDAKNHPAVHMLRLRKARETKPFAVMARNLNVVHKYCRVSPMEEELLTSGAAPIVVLNLKTGLSDLQLPPELAPNLDTLGVMLPYTPLHHLLFDDELELLVMTSANRSGEPMITDNDAAFTKLRGIADYWLTHNRDIYHPCDDSVIRVIAGQPVFFRRSRGYVPLPVELKRPGLSVLGVGGDIKNTFCLLKERQGFISQYGGDLANYDNFKGFEHSIVSFQRIVNCKPDLIAYDLHPEYHSSRFARNSNLPSVAVQHHHAHLASCLAENQVEENVLGVICDGTGFGLDQQIWGFEFLWGGQREFVRVGHLEYLPLPGGDAAARFPDRLALAYLVELFTADGKEFHEYLPSLTDTEIDLITQQVQRRINTFLTSSCGRLFDAVSALCGICTKVAYEGQAAIELEAAIDQTEQGTYNFTLTTGENGLQIKTKTLFGEILADLAQGVSAGRIAAKFHRAIGDIIVEALRRLEDKYDSRQVALSGGVLQNKYLAEYLMQRLNQLGFVVYRQSVPGDGGLCLGQAVIASEVMKNVSGDSR